MTRSPKNRFRAGGRSAYRGSGLLAALALLALFVAGCRKDESATAHRAPSALPNIILMTLESIRPGHLGLYGYSRDTSPAIDELAREGIVFENAHAVTSWTLTSHASLFTGFYPPTHGVLLPRDRLSDSYTTIAEVLQARGYQTAAYVSGPFLRRDYNLDQGFEIYEDSPSSVSHREAHGDITNPTMELLFTRFLLEERRPGVPFFLFLYVWDPHYDYIPPPPYDTKFVPPDAVYVEVRNYIGAPDVHAGMPPEKLAYVISQYDGEINWTDVMLGHLWELLRKQGLWDNTAIIVTADHGEEFFEHGDKGHKNNLYVESVHVPLIIKPANKVPPSRDPRLVSLVDLYPTVLGLVGAKTDHTLHGRSLLEPASPGPRSIFFELTTTWYRLVPPDVRPKLFSDRWVALRYGNLKLVAQPEKNRWELYDVRKDPRELSPLGAEHDAELQRLRGMLSEYEDSMREQAMRYERAEQIDLTEEEHKRLESLGYINGGDPDKDGP